MGEIVGLKPAADLAGVTEAAVLKWCRRLEIGEQRQGRWYINARKLHEVINARRVLRLDVAA